MIDGAWKLSNPVLGLVVVALTFLLFYVVGFISNRKAALAAITVFVFFASIYYLVVPTAAITS